MMLFSRIVVFKYFLPKVMAITAIGMEADTVNPAFKARYTEEQPKRMPNKEPNTTDFIVNSAIFCSGAMYGLNTFELMRRVVWFRNKSKA